jgi:hypothetical protein
MDDQTTSQAVRVIINSEQVQRFGRQLYSKFIQYESDRRLAELKFARNARQYLGVYDPDIESKLDPTRSRAFPKLTRWKCISMLSRCMNLLFQDSDKPWAVEASPVPNLDAVDLAPLLKSLDQQAQKEQPPRAPTDDEIEQAIRVLAGKRAERLELEIQDQLRELGGNRTLDYVALCRKVLLSGIQYGMGILKGPFIDEQKQRRWKRDAQDNLVAETFTAQRPRFEFIPIWDYYPDLSAKTLAQMDGQFTRLVMSRAQVIELKKRKDFLTPQIDAALNKFGGGNYKRRAYETEVRSMGVQLNVTESERGKFEIIVWDGNVSGKDLHATGATVTDEQMNLTVRSCIWFIDDIVVKAEIDPWTVLAGEEAPAMFHHFIFEEDESTLFGNGLPNIMRDSQMGLAAAVRMVLDNGSIVCGLNLEVNTELLNMNQDISSIQPNKIWYREDANPATLAYPAVREIKMDSHISELKMVSDMFLAFADQETFIGPATGGDMQKGPSEPFRTAAGASLLRGDAALPFKDVVRNFDVFTQSLIGSLLVFNKQFNKNPQTRGDFQAVARGATSLIAKEVLGIQLDNLATTLTEEEKMYVNMRELVRARIRVRDLAVKNIVVDDAEADRRERAESDRRAAQDQQQQRMVEATIKETLAKVIKDLSQAGKNSAAAEAATANVILAALEKGLSPNALAQATQGATAAGNDQPQPPGTGAESSGGTGAAATPDGAGAPVGGNAGGAAVPSAGGQSAGAVAAPA